MKESQVRVRVRVRLGLGLGLGFSLGLGLGLRGYGLGKEFFLLLLFYFTFVYICVLMIFIYFFACRKIRKVLTGVLVRVQARSPGSSPGFDVSISRFLRFSRAKQRQVNVQKIVLQVQNCFFAN